MQTIPLKPVFDNRQFQDCTPLLKFAILNAVYLLCSQNRASDMPERIQPYFGICSPTYFRNKKVLIEILNDVMPKICKFKSIRYNMAAHGTRGLQKKAVKRRTERLSEEKFLDKSDSHTEIIPVKILRERWNPGQSDPVERDKAIASNSEEKESWFTDKPNS